MGYARPTDLTEALSLLTPTTTIAAGCTDLFPATTAPALRGDILDITAIPALRGITRTDNGLRIGAATTWADILAADLPPACDGLKSAAREVGSVQIQTSGTIAGNLCNASPAADGVPPLLTLGAGVELTSTGGTRYMALSDFITGPRRTARAPGEIVTAVTLTDLAGSGAFHKLGARRYLVISIVMAAARLETDGDRITAAALSVGACSPVAIRLGTLETALIGAKAQDIAGIVAATDLPLAPIDDVRADVTYRKEAARTVLTRAIQGALG